MSKKPTKIIGLTIADFKSLVSKGNEINLQPYPKLSVETSTTKS